MKVALVYDRVNKWGGAERVLLALHELFPQAPLYTSVYHYGRAPWAGVFDIRTSFLQNFPFAKDSHELYPLLMPAAFESFTFDDYDLVISVTSEAAKGVITKPGIVHICYCLTPTRYLWSGRSEYFSNPFLSFLATPAISYLKKWDLVAASRPDHYIAISEEVKTRLHNFYGRDSAIIHPPVELFAGIPLKKTAGDYYLVVSRLVAYKRVDLAIKACNRLGLPLKIVGTGNEEEHLRKIAGPTVEFIGSISDEGLIKLYQHAKALIFPGLEDFGIVMAESLGFGKPVIAFARGGAKDIVEDGRSGVLFASQNVTALVEAIVRSQKIDFDPKTLRKRAELFSKAQFKIKFSRYIEEICKSIK